MPDPDEKAVDPSSLEALRALLDSVGAYIFTKDREGRYTYANGPLLRLLGGTAEQVLGTRALDHVSADCARQIHEHDQQVLQTGAALEVEEFNVLPGRPDRRVFWTVKRALRDAHGQVVGLCGVSTDITERKAMEDQLAEQRQLLKAVLNHIDAYVYMKDETRTYRYVNDKVARVWGIPAEEAVGKRDIEVMPLERADLFWQTDQKVFDGGTVATTEETFVDEAGEVRHHWSIKVPIRYEGVPTLIGFSTDITELVRLREQLRVQAISDGLTGVYNRRHFGELAERELARARRHQHPTALLLADIDHFKRVNDTHGHPMGDAVLVRVAQLLKGQARAEDSVARFGGEEFALLLPKTDAAAAHVMAERIRLALRADRGVLPQQGYVTVSIGMAVVSDGKLSVDQLYAEADAQLYLAKQSGRDRVCPAL